MILWPKRLLFLLPNMDQKTIKVLILNFDTVDFKILYVKLKIQNYSMIFNLIKVTYVSEKKFKLSQWVKNLRAPEL